MLNHKRKKLKGNKTNAIMHQLNTSKIIHGRSKTLRSGSQCKRSENNITRYKGNPRLKENQVSHPLTMYYHRNQSHLQRIFELVLT